MKEEVNLRIEYDLLSNKKLILLLTLIERGRHLNIPKTERYCLLCKSNQIEDEKHFLLHCKKFNTQRNIFNEKISNK
jgi:hypothetical protein